MTASGSVSSSAALARDGTIYFGSSKGAVYALNPDGTKRWEFLAAGNVETPTLGADGTIYFGSADRNFYALRPDGTKKWSYAATGGIACAPAIALDGTIYFGGDEGSSPP